MAPAKTNTFTDRLLNIMAMHHRLTNLYADVDFNSSIVSETPASDKGQKIALGQKDPFFQLPKDFEPIMAPGILSPLGLNLGVTAGTFKFKGKRVGFLRIPSYVPTLIQFANFGLRFYIAQLERKSDLLIIDQTFNPGGYVAYSDWLVAALNGGYDPNRHMRFAVKPTQSYMRQFLDVIAAIQDEKEIPDSIKKKYVPLLQENFAKIQKAYVSRAALSEPIQLWITSALVEDLIDASIEKLMADHPKMGALTRLYLAKLAGADLTRRQVYTKPVFMLTNELDFSGADATPVGLQDYGRIKTVGINTAGAGGAVEEFSNHIYNPFTYHLTTSLMVRKDGSYVENLGAKPDISFETKISDYADGFSTYFNRLLNTIVP
jgi:hypothetical protein